MSEMRTVMIADCNKEYAGGLKLLLQQSGYRVECVTEENAAYQMAIENNVDLALIAQNLPGMNGFALTEKIRKNLNIPIIMYSEKLAEGDRIRGLNIGADDVLEKTANNREIAARVNAQLRRYFVLNPAQGEKVSEDVIRLEGLSLNLESLTLSKDGHNVPITPNEYKILYLLMRRPGKVFSKADLCRAVNGEIYDNYENAIMVHIFHLREKIENDPKKPTYLRNVRGVGYTMCG